jgi:hypothetical protein
MVSYEELFLQMKPYLISHLKHFWYSMLIMVFLVLGIGFIQNIMNFLLDLLNFPNKFGFSIKIGVSMGGLFLCIYNEQSYDNGGQWLESQAHLKRVVANRVVEGYFVAMLNIRKASIPCAWMFGIVHPQDI